IAEAKQSLLRMANLNRSLLMLSRIENQQYTAMEEVNFNNALQELVRELDYLVEHKEIQLHYQEERIFRCMYNRELAFVLLANLLRNAIKHNQKGGVIRIAVAEDAIQVANSATAGALDTTSIYERF